MRVYSRVEAQQTLHVLVSLNAEIADALTVCPIPDACLLVMAQRPYRSLGLPETRSLISLIKNSPDQVEGYLDYLQPKKSFSCKQIFTDFCLV
jgi:hypothetical protein